MVDGFFCICPPLLTGKQCTDLIDYCENRPCKNDGICLNAHFTYRCICTYGWQGNNCTEMVDFCSEGNPCQNSGNCSNVPGGYLCECQTQFSGKFCESLLRPVATGTAILRTQILSSTMSLDSAPAPVSVFSRVSLNPASTVSMEISPTRVFWSSVDLFSVAAYLRTSSINAFIPTDIISSKSSLVGPIVTHASLLRTSLLKTETMLTDRALYRFSSSSPAPFLSSLYESSIPPFSYFSTSEPQYSVSPDVLLRTSEPLQQSEPTSEPLQQSESTSEPLRQSEPTSEPLQQSESKIMKVISVLSPPELSILTTEQGSTNSLGSVKLAESSPRDFIHVTGSSILPVYTMITSEISELPLHSVPKLSKVSSVMVTDSSSAPKYFSKVDSSAVSSADGQQTFISVSSPKVYKQTVLTTAIEELKSTIDKSIVSTDSSGNLTVHFTRTSIKAETKSKVSSVTSISKEPLPPSEMMLISSSLIDASVESKSPYQSTSVIYASETPDSDLHVGISKTLNDSIRFVTMPGTSYYPVLIVGTSSAIVLPSSAIVPTSSAIVPTSSAIVPTSSAIVPTLSAIVPTSSPIVPTSSAIVPTSSAIAPASSAIVPTSSAVVPTSSAIIPASSAIVPTSSAIIPASSAVVPASSAIVPSSSAIVPASSAIVPTSSAIVPTSSAENVSSTSVPGLSDSLSGTIRMSSNFETSHMKEMSVHNFSKSNLHTISSRLDAYSQISGSFTSDITSSRETMVSDVISSSNHSKSVSVLISSTVEPGTKLSGITNQRSAQEQSTVSSGSKTDVFYTDMKTFHTYHTSSKPIESSDLVTSSSIFSAGSSIGIRSENIQPTPSVKTVTMGESKLSKTVVNSSTPSKAMLYSKALSFKQTSPVSVTSTVSEIDLSSSTATESVMKTVVDSNVLLVSSQIMAGLHSSLTDTSPGIVLSSASLSVTLKPSSTEHEYSVTVSSVFWTKQNFDSVSKYSLFSSLEFKESVVISDTSTLPSSALLPESTKMSDKLPLTKSLISSDFKHFVSILTSSDHSPSSVSLVSTSRTKSYTLNISSEIIATKSSFLGSVSAASLTKTMPVKESSLKSKSSLIRSVFREFIVSSSVSTIQPSFTIHRLSREMLTSLPSIVTLTSKSIETGLPESPFTSARLLTEFSKADSLSVFAIVSSFTTPSSNKAKLSTVSYIEVFSSASTIPDSSTSAVSSSTTVSTTSPVSLCDSVQCYNGGVCRSTGTTPVCDCLPRFTGFQCEIGES